MSNDVGSKNDVTTGEPGLLRAKHEKSANLDPAPSPSSVSTSSDGNGAGMTPGAFSNLSPASKRFYYFNIPHEYKPSLSSKAGYYSTHRETTKSMNEAISEFERRGQPKPRMLADKFSRMAKQATGYDISSRQLNEYVAQGKAGTTPAKLQNAEQNIEQRHTLQNDFQSSEGEKFGKNFYYLKNKRVEAALATAEAWHHQCGR